MKKSGNPKKKKKIIIISVILVIIAFYAYGFSLQTVRFKIESDKADNIKIVFLSDLHNCFYGGFDQSGLTDRINEENPDIVLFGGDVIDQYGGTKYALKIMSETVKNYPCFYTAGNHELWRDDRKDFNKQVKELGITVLEGGAASRIEVNGQGINIVGIIEATYYNEQYLKSLSNPDDYNILLLHQPIQINDVLDAGFDLVLSGHAHGGQWRLPFILEQGLYSPDEGIFPDYTNGIYQYGDTTHIISKGLARPLRMIFIPRIYNRPEFTVIEI